MLTFGDRVARLGLSVLMIAGICLLVRSAFGPNALVHEMSRAIDQGKISKAVVFSCGAILIEVMPDDPAMLFHEGNMNGATSEICKRKEFRKTDNDIATKVDTKTNLRDWSNLPTILGGTFLSGLPFHRI